MNLNSYIGLMGGATARSQTPAGLNLLPAGEPPPDLVVPECDYVLTIDADSVIMPEYCLRLVHLLERRGAQRQSPWPSRPTAPSPAPRRGSSGSPARPPTCSTSSTRG